MQFRSDFLITSKRAPFKGPRRRGDIVLRMLAGVAGGYLLASLAAAVLTAALCWLGSGRADAVAVATLTALPAYVASVLWAFGAASSGRAWLGLAAPCLVMAIALWGVLRAGLVPA